MKGYRELAKAASDGDKLSTRLGLEETLARLDLDVTGVFKAAEQRALRCVLAATGDERMAEVERAADEGRYLSLRLTEEQKRLMPVAQLGIVDGIAMAAIAFHPGALPIDGSRRTGGQ